MRILVIEDHPTQLKLAHDVLCASNNAVTNLESAEEALESIKLERPEVILLDLGLPGMSGLEFARRLKSDPETEDISIVAVTAFPEMFSKADALAAGCDAYILKPLKTATLSDDLALTLVKDSGPDLEQKNLNRIA
ncbi:MAG TPA: response regulator [Fimbriimonadaceae bacterium]|jgi:CheY-like chemotaxis protein